jgi:hypothetical protein
VAKEQNWSRRETLEYLAKMGGFYCKFEEIEGKITLTTYESSKARMDSEDYVKVMWRKRDLWWVR